VWQRLRALRGRLIPVRGVLETAQITQIKLDDDILRGSAKIGREGVQFPVAMESRQILGGDSADVYAFCLRLNLHLALMWSRLGFQGPFVGVG
jgi:hypothetical protein